MPSLIETQAFVRDAIVTGWVSDVSPLLVGGQDPQHRLAIHQRHYEVSLVSALLSKFPATAWLVGTPFVEQHARAFVRQNPPRLPCIAEYGAEFPEFLAARPGAERVPYLRSFGELEWAIGCVSIAIERPTVSADRLAANAIDALPDVVLTLQPGLRWLCAEWPIDDLMTLYLTNTAPEQLVLDPAAICVQVRGARGAFQIDRLHQGDLLFREAIVDGMTLGDAAGRALDQAAEFDAGRALAALFAEQLVIAIAPNGGHAT